ncbi:uncharacterized protein LOC109843147 isoform X1 [Asparagus officinalis]|uniref:uncharacterized protein LOC109843147 isoform X1 n=1 Tax=Asparagus officinalis TaxID=4686 RepID=UPI00098E6DB3|nr:uncharacterized protein LOC109843147 isoform X1 [Asparagus officinalis]
MAWELLFRLCALFLLSSVSSLLLRIDEDFTCSTTMVPTSFMCTIMKTSYAGYTSLSELWCSSSSELLFLAMRQQCTLLSSSLGLLSDLSHVVTMELLPFTL